MNDQKAFMSESSRPDSNSYPLTPLRSGQEGSKPSSPFRESIDPDGLKSTPAHKQKADAVEKAAQVTVLDDDSSPILAIFNDDSWARHSANPYNWNTSAKWKQALIVCWYSLVTSLASSMVAPGLPDIAERYHITNPTVSALTLSVFLLAFMIGPLVSSPMSEMLGRRWIFHISNLIFIIFNLVCAWAPNTAALIIFRAIAGLGGATPIAIGGGTMSDVFPPRERAGALAIYSMGPLMGPVLGPIAGGFIAETIGYRWVFIIISCFSLPAIVAGVFILKETYHPVIRQRLLRDLGAEDYAKKLALKGFEGLTKSQILWMYLSRPLVLLTTNIILFALALFMAIQYGFMYLMFTTFPELFSEVYHFSSGITGLAYIGFGVGLTIGIIFGGSVANKLYLTLSARNGDVPKPEFRVPSMILGGLLTPIGLLWFGWSAQKQIHFMMPIVGSGFVGCALILTAIPIQLYLVDTFKYAASALAAVAVLRSLFGFFFPLFAGQMFDALTIGGGYSLLAGISVLVGVPFPIWLYFYGEKVRARSNQNR